jgi:2-polyprenyl-3-methyl-5-hydroxy-6-metoxy-1,4-benzoquinol methylase
MSQPVETLPLDAEAVRWAYRLFLNREPESEEAVRFHLATSGTVGELRRGFIGSAEFQGQLGAIARPSMTGDEGALDIEAVDDPQRLQQLFDHIARSWSHMGETDAHWSVLTNEGFHADRIDANRDVFYATADEDIGRFLATLSRNGMALPRGARCLEIGCGVGRITRRLAQHCAQVIGIDVSPGHLRFAREHLDAQGVRNVELRQLRHIDELAAIGPIDVFFTAIVLQHNPPPVIAAILDRVFAQLKPGGIAYFQVPTYERNYRFAARSYLRARGEELDMEMHVLPQKDVLAIAARHGLQTVEILEHAIPELRMGHMSNYFLLRKPG